MSSAFCACLCSSWTNRLLQATDHSATQVSYSMSNPPGGAHGGARLLLLPSCFTLPSSQMYTCQYVGCCSWLIPKACVARTAVRDYRCVGRGSIMNGVLYFFPVGFAASDASLEGLKFLLLNIYERGNADSHLATLYCCKSAQHKQSTLCKYSL